MKYMRLAALVLLSTLCSCATIINGGPDHVPVQSDPSGATIRLDGQEVGRTPATIVVKRTATGQVVLELEGYHPQRIQMIGTLNPALFGNILIGGPIGILIDACSGAAGLWSDKAMNIRLVKLSEPAPEELHHPGIGTTKTAEEAEAERKAEQTGGAYTVFH